MLYCVDLDEKRLEITEFDKETILEDMEYFNVRNALDLETWDRRLFKTKESAEKFLTDFSLTMQSLRSQTSPKRRHPAMLYKRRYIALSLMGVKLYTERDYCKKWEPGQMFDLHDQTHFLSVTLKKIEKRPNDKFRYSFTV